jgi:acyl-CoA dehydrogenase
VSDAQELWRAARAFVEGELEPLGAKVEAEDAVPQEAVRKMAELGYFGLTIDPEYGGLGLDVDTYCGIVEELGRTHSAFFMLIDDNNGMGSSQIATNGTAEQRALLLPAIASGEAGACFALTEPEAGSDGRAVRTYARRVDDHYILECWMGEVLHRNCANSTTRGKGWCNLGIRS